MVELQTGPFFIFIKFVYLINVKKNFIMAAFNQQELDIATGLLRAIAHPLRLTILEFIDSKEVFIVIY